MQTGDLFEIGDYLSLVLVASNEDSKACFVFAVDFLRTQAFGGKDVESEVNGRKARICAGVGDWIDEEVLLNLELSVDRLPKKDLGRACEIYADWIDLVLGKDTGIDHRNENDLGQAYQERLREIRNELRIAQEGLFILISFESDSIPARPQKTFVLRRKPSVAPESRVADSMGVAAGPEGLIRVELTGELEGCYLNESEKGRFQLKAGNEIKQSPILPDYRLVYRNYVFSPIAGSTRREATFQIPKNINYQGRRLIVRHASDFVNAEP